MFHPIYEPYCNPSLDLSLIDVFRDGSWLRTFSRAIKNIVRRAGIRPQMQRRGMLKVSHSSLRLSPRFTGGKRSHLSYDLSVFCAVCASFGQFFTKQIGTPHSHLCARKSGEKNRKPEQGAWLSAKIRSEVSVEGMVRGRLRRGSRCRATRASDGRAKG